MKTNRTWLVSGAVVLALGAVVTGTALARDDPEPAEAPADDAREDAAEGGDVAISDAAAREQAESAALEHLGEGRVTATEVGDEESYYEVEVTLEDGRQVDVQLDEQFRVVGDETDGAGQDD